jgi:hypothetical protein
MRPVCFGSAGRDPWTKISAPVAYKVAKLTLQRSILGLLRIGAELARHRRFPSGGGGPR